MPSEAFHVGRQRFEKRLDAAWPSRINAAHDIEVVLAHLQLIALGAV
jgi:hypothetical protein